MISDVDLDVLRARWTPQDEIIARLEEEGRPDVARDIRRFFEQGKWQFPVCVLCPGSDERMCIGEGFSEPERQWWQCAARGERECVLSDAVPELYEGAAARGDVIDLVALLDGVTREEAAALVAKRLMRA